MSHVKIEAQPVQLTEGAVRQLRKIQESERIPSDHGLRIGVKGGGCSGFSYVLGFDVEKEGDSVYELPERSELFVAEGVEGVAFKVDLAGGGCVEGAEDVEKGAFPAAAGPGDGDDLPGQDF